MEKRAETGTGGIPRRAFNNPRAMESLGSSNLANSFDLPRGVASSLQREVYRNAGGDPAVLTKIDADNRAISRTARIMRGQLKDATASRNSANKAENQRQIDNARRNYSDIVQRTNQLNNDLVSNIVRLTAYANANPAQAAPVTALANKLKADYDANNRRIGSLRAGFLRATGRDPASA